MKIIRRGHGKDPIMRGTCDECDIDIECNRSETTDRSHRGEMGDRGIRCPECKGWIDTYIVE